MFFCNPELLTLDQSQLPFWQLCECAIKFELNS